MCSHAARFARRIDRNKRFAIVPYQTLSDGELASAGLDRRRASRALVCIVEDGSVFTGAFAVNAFARRFWWMAPLAFAVERIPLSLAAEAIGYAAVAHSRGALAGLLGLGPLSRGGETS